MQQETQSTLRYASRIATHRPPRAIQARSRTLLCLDAGMTFRRCTELILPGAKKHEREVSSVGSST